MPSATGQPWGDPHSALDCAREAVASAGRTTGAQALELCLRGGELLSLETPVRLGAAVHSQGGRVFAWARVWREDRLGAASGTVTDPAGLRDLLRTAWEAAAAGAPAPLPLPGVRGPSSAPPPPPLDRGRAEQSAQRLLRWVQDSPLLPQTLLVRQERGWFAVASSVGTATAGWLPRQAVYLRCETPEGALVDGTATPGLDGPLELEALALRLLDSAGGLGGTAPPPPGPIPVVLRPVVAGPLVAALLWLLRGDSAVASAGLRGAVSRKLAPSSLTVRDLADHPAGTLRREVDDEGRTAEAVTLIDQGRLLNFLHSGATAAAMGVAPNGRGLREEEEPLPGSSGLNPFVVPGQAALPARCLELVGRLETFTTMPRVGRVTLRVLGHRVEDGRRVERLAPLELELGVMAALRALGGCGPDLCFLPTHGGCGTPSLIFDRLEGLGG